MRHSASMTSFQSPATRGATVVSVVCQLTVHLSAVNPLSVSRYMLYGLSDLRTPRNKRTRVCSSMDDPWIGTSEQNAALVILAFLQSDCRNSDYMDELISLGKELNFTRDINCNGRFIDPMDDGDLETDGHLPSCTSVFLHDVLPLVELQWPRNNEAGENLHQVAEGLREIAAQIEHNIVAQATRNLRHNISTSPAELWKNHLTFEVERVMRQGVGLEHLPQERVFIALTLTLVRGVCEQVPVLLRNLFNAALQYISPITAR